MSTGLEESINQINDWLGIISHVFLHKSTSYSLGNGESFSWLKRKDREAIQAPAFSAISIMHEVLPRSCYTVVRSDRRGTLRLSTYFIGRSRWPCGLRCRSVVARLTGSRIQITPVCLLCVVCCQAEVPASSCSLVQRSPTQCGVSH
jgi:hypothetical protein